MILTVFKIHFSSHMTIPVKVPLITVKDTGVQRPPGRPDHSKWHDYGKSC